MNNFKIVFKLLSNKKKLAYLVATISIIAAILETVGFSLILPILNSLFNQGEQFSSNGYLDFFNSIFTADQKLWALPALLITIFLLRTIFILLNIYLTNLLTWQLRSHYANLLMKKYTNTLYELIIKKKTGEIINATLTETYRASQGVRYLIEFLTKTFLMISLVILLLISNFYLTISLLFGILIILLSFRKIISASSYNIGRKRLALSEEHTEKCTELIESIKESKILGIQSKLLESFDSSVKKYSNVNVLYTLLTSIPQSLSELLLVLVFSTGLIIVGLMSYDINFLLPTLVLYLAVSIRLVQTFSNMTMIRMRFISLIPSMDKIIDYLDERLEQERSDGTIPEELNININNLSFSYGNNDPIFKDINIYIKEKSFVGLVGKSGTGKSTFVNILTALLFPTNGEILIDGKNLSSMDIKSWRKRIGYVSQSPFLFNDTIYNNILYGNVNASPEEVIESAKLSNSYEFINQLPNKFDTIVGQRGAALSGGQLQRIAIARSIIGKPSLLIFDECTNALDQENENIIKETIENLSTKHTIIVITHNKHVIEKADEIYQFKNKDLVLTNFREIV